MEVIIRNIAAGSFSKRYGVEEGTPLKISTIEFSYKNDALGDPLINDYHALALGLCTEEELNTIKKYAFAVNDMMKEYLLNLGIILVDFKLEVWQTRRRYHWFWRTRSPPIPAASGIRTPCRSWIKTGSAEIWAAPRDAYQEVMKRLMGE